MSVKGNRLAVQSREAGLQDFFTPDAVDLNTYPAGLIFPGVFNGKGSGGGVWINPEIGLIR